MNSLDLLKAELPDLRRQFSSPEKRADFTVDGPDGTGIGLDFRPSSPHIYVPTTITEAHSTLLLFLIVECPLYLIASALLFFYPSCDVIINYSKFEGRICLSLLLYGIN